MPVLPKGMTGGLRHHRDYSEQFENQGCRCTSDRGSYIPAPGMGYTSTDDLAQPQTRPTLSSISPGSRLVKTQSHGLQSVHPSGKPRLQTVESWIEDHRFLPQPLRENWGVRLTRTCSVNGCEAALKKNTAAIVAIKANLSQSGLVSRTVDYGLVPWDGHDSPWSNTNAVWSS